MKKIYSNAVLTVINIAHEDIITSSPRSFSVSAQGFSLNDYNTGYELNDSEDGDIIW